MDFDRLAGEIVTYLRTSAGLSQADLAARLAEAGLAMHQQTVAKIEKGTRPLRLQEAQMIADVTGNDMWVFDGARKPDRAAIARIFTELEAARNRAAESVDHYAQVWKKTIEMLAKTSEDVRRESVGGMELEEMCEEDAFAERMAHLVADVERKRHIASSAHRNRTGGLVGAMEEIQAHSKVFLDSRDHSGDVPGIGEEDDHEIELEPFPDEPPVREEDVHREQYKSARGKASGEVTQHKIPSGYKSQKKVETDG